MAMFTVCILTVALLLAADAASTAEIVNPGESRGHCRQQIEGQRLSSCHRYLRDSSRFEPRPENEGTGWREEFPRCCEELQRITEHCRCEAIKQVAQEQRQTGELQGREIREMFETAQSLPSLCRISPQYCENIRGGGPMF